MKVLVVGAINGDFVAVNNLIEETNCDIVMSTGNIGVYYFHDKLLPKKQKNNNFYHFLGGKKKLLKPLVAVPGSRENYFLVSKFFEGRLDIENFQILRHGQKVVIANDFGAVGITGLGGGYSPKYYMHEESIEFKYSNMRYFKREDVVELMKNSSTNVLLMHELIGPYVNKNISFTPEQLDVFFGTTAIYCFAGRYEKWLHARFPRSYQCIEFIGLPKMANGYGIFDTNTCSFNGVNKIVEGK